ncbi:MAG: hypothetical protein K2Q09_11050 [Phycisphaerales bacterium]|nr:hypothetical protein [Phycisphaerales bacterium]
MSQLPPTPAGPAGPENDPLAAPSPALVRRRPASVQLRQSGPGSPGTAAASADDQSTQALGDALRVVYRFLQAGMLILVVVFLFSGLKTVKEGERGIRVAFGKAQADDLTPGFQISLPQPLGDILKIDTGNRVVNEDNQFWLRGSGPERYADDAALARNKGTPNLDPISDGFLLTGDLSIGHAVVRVEYGRDPGHIYEFARGIHPEAEQRIVLGAVRRGIVRAAASVTIDQFRKEGVLQAEALRIAQQSLDDLHAGLQIRSFDVTRRTVPAGLINKFNEVEASVNNAAKVISEAEQARQATLASTAGAASEQALTLIDRYDALYTAGKREEADGVLGQIDALLAGSAAIEGRPTVFASGRATQSIESARADKARAVSRAQGDAALFTAKRAAFLSNPGVVLLGDWADAFGSFVNRDTVQVFLMPQGVTTLDMNLNRDQDLVKEQEQEAARRKQEEINRNNTAALRKAELKPVERPREGN